MKLITSVLILGLTGTALAQKPASKTVTAPAAKPQAAATATAKPAQTTKTAQSSTAKSATPAKHQAAAAKSTPAKAAEKKPAAKQVPAANTAETKAPEAGEQKTEEKVSAKNRRDPFVSIVMSREGPPCAGGGKKCLAIDQVILQGVVRSPNGPIAVVSGGTNKTYFLRENDPVYNGVVVKISPDSILFRETVMDRLGKTSQRDVVKKIRPSV